MRIPLVLSGALAACALGLLSAQEPPSPGTAPANESPGEAVPAPNGILTTLQGLIDSMDPLRAEQAEARRDLEALRASGADPSELKAAEDALKSVAEELASLQKKFERLATGIGETALDEHGAEDLNLQDELTVLLEPMLYELRKSTERPREIERLRTALAGFERRREIVDESLNRLNSLLPNADGEDLRTTLQGLKEGLTARQARLKSELEAARFQLQEALDKQDPVFSMLGRVLSDFLARRGRSFGLALLAGVGTFLLFVLLVRVTERFLPDTDDFRRSLAFRVARLSFLGLAGVCAVFAFLGVLYTQSDWLLLGLSLIFILGLLWAAKQALLPFYEQLKTALNLGPVREGERVMFDGIPWEVKSINFYTDLVNPMLTGGHVRVAIADLTDLHSRPKAREEPLFPCRTGEWVKLSDGTYGEVISQTPELVRIRTVPGSIVSYQTVTFLGLAPDNHSEKFGLRVTIGVDYQHQKISTNAIREKLEAHIRAGLEEDIGKENITAFWVEFESAGASSLDYCVGASFVGEVANRRPSLIRAIQRHYVDACNENGWVIPFTQVTIHQAS
ncbi:MAG: hypothetical protein HKO57_09435 [Akkermansiaceae bacterium]|nr:hypothetical protein [Akkermansiaceae bacterium]